MNRTDFMKQLESLLQNISQAEREEALQYYNDYFDDAGPDNEQAVMEALGNPAKVAENIKRDLFGNGYGEKTKVTAGDRAVIPYGQKGDNGPEEHCSDENVTSEKNSADSVKNGKSGKLSTGVIALIVVLAVLAAPVLLSVASGLLAAVVGILAGWFSLILGFGAAAIALFASALVLAVVAVLCVLFHPLVGITLLGGGLLCAGAGVLFMMLTVAMAGVATPAIWRGCVSLVKKLTGKSSSKKAQA